MKRQGILRGLGAAIAALAFAGTAAAHDLRVEIDSSRALQLSAPAQGVAIGNASIVGVSVQNDQLLFLTGRSYGSTTLQVIGANGRVLYSGRVTVTPNEENAVMVMRGTDVSRMSCAPVCRPDPDIGDSVVSYNAANTQQQAHASGASGSR